MERLPRVVFAAPSIKRLIYLILVTVAAFAVQFKFNHAQDYWLIWSALIISLLTTGEAFKSRIGIMLLTGVAAGLSAVIAASLTSLFPVLAIYLFIITTGCMLLSQRYPHYFLTAFIINLFAIVSAGLPATMPDSGYRFIFILMGAAIALIFQVLFYFHFVINEWHGFIMVTLRQLKKLNTEMFSCYLQPEYIDNIYLYERRIHLQKNKCVTSITSLLDMTPLIEKSLPEKERNQHQLAQKKFDEVYDLLLDCSQLRRRVSDHTTFTICSEELTAICQEIERLFEGLMAVVMGKKFFPHINMLQEKIQRLEETYNHVLQVSAREPLVFLLFIFSLKALSNEMAACYEVFAS
jgi:hypothetical protein